MGKDLVIIKTSLEMKRKDFVIKKERSCEYKKGLVIYKITIS